MSIPKAKQVQILNSAIDNLKAQIFDLEIAVKVNRKIGAEKEKTEKLADSLIETEKRLAAYEEELANINTENEG